MRWNCWELHRDPDFRHAWIERIFIFLPGVNAVLSPPLLPSCLPVCLSCVQVFASILWDRQACAKMMASKTPDWQQQSDRRLLPKYTPGPQSQSSLSFCVSLSVRVSLSLSLSICLFLSICLSISLAHSFLLSSGESKKLKYKNNGCFKLAPVTVKHCFA